MNIKVAFVCCVLIASPIFNRSHAQEYPTHAVTVVVPYPPGGSVDILARMIQPTLETALRQPIIVINRPGAGGNLGAQFVAKSKPDGYTLLLSTNAPLTMTQHLMKEVDFDYRAFAGVKSCWRGLLRDGG